MFGRTKAKIVVLALATAACTGDAVDTVTVTVVQSPTTGAPTTSAQAAEPTATPQLASTMVAGPIDICGTGVAWTEDVVHAADCFVIPVAFLPQDAEWRSLSVGDEWVELFWGDTSAGAIAAHLLLLAYETRDLPEQVIDSITSIEGVNAIDSASVDDLGGRDAAVIEVVTDRDPQLDDRCSTGMFMGLRNFTIGGGFNASFPLADVGPAGANRGYGFGACKQFRVWVLDVDGTSITVIATAAGAADEHFDELLPTIERLLDSMSFEAA